MRTRVQALFKKTKPKLKTPYERALYAIYLFDFLDRLRLEKFPSTWYRILTSDTELLLKYFTQIPKTFEFSRNDFSSWTKSNAESDFAVKTGEVYYRLWKNFKKDEYFKETAKILKERLDKNGIKVKGIPSMLDDGCGGGRYTLALKSLGVKKVVGFDISKNAIELAKKMSPFTKSEVTFIQGSVLKLPFKKSSFDFVFSNGVLHHTTSTEKGLDEIYRVLKPGGDCWLYLYGGKESFFWDAVDFCRELLKDVPQEYTQTLMKTLGYPPGRIFHRCDFFYVPVNRRYFESEIDKMLKKSGFSSWKRLHRGVATDWDEIIHNNPKIDPYIYGEGEMRFLVTK